MLTLKSVPWSIVIFFGVIITGMIVVPRSIVDYPSSVDVWRVKKNAQLVQSVDPGDVITMSDSVGGEATLCVVVKNIKGSAASDRDKFVFCMLPRGHIKPIPKDAEGLPYWSVGWDSLKSIRGVYRNDRAVQEKWFQKVIAQ